MIAAMGCFYPNERCRFELKTPPGLYRPFREILAESCRAERPLSSPLLEELQRQQEIFRLEHPERTHQPMPAWTPEKDTERHAAF